MKNVILYFTGTGNSLWVSRLLARELGDAELVSIPDYNQDTTDIDIAGLVFPVHVWGLPVRIVRFVDELVAMKPRYTFGIAVHAGQVANTLVQLRNLTGSKGLALASGYEIKMPSNYIPWGGPGNREKQQQLFEKAKGKIASIAAYIKSRQKRPVEKGPLWERIVFTPLYNMSLPYLPKEARKFWVDAKCNGCGICCKVCPSLNVRMQGEKPVWGEKCDQCLACLQWCPEEAIQFGKKTPRYERYHHPEVLLKDVLKKR